MESDFDVVISTVGHEVFHKLADTRAMLHFIENNQGTTAHQPRIEIRLQLEKQEIEVTRVKKEIAQLSRCCRKINDKGRVVVGSGKFTHQRALAHTGSTNNQ